MTTMNILINCFVTLIGNKNLYLPFEPVLELPFSLGHCIGQLSQPGKKIDTLNNST